METLWEKLQFWKKKRTMLKEGIDYTFLDFDNSEITGVALLNEEFNGVIYHYNKARVVEEGEIARLQFGYTIVHPGNFNIDDMNSNEKFRIIMGDILTEILTRKTQDEQIRTDYSKEPDTQ